MHDVSRKKGGGRKGINVEELQRKVKETPFSDRQTIRRLSLVIIVPKTTLHRSLKIGALQRAASSIKPHLTPQNKEHRVAYCRSFVEGDNYFSDMMDRVDIDEKWFYITQKRTKYIVVPGEVVPLRTCKHKSHLIKVMCMTAVARPREIAATGEWWDGKIGTWFFTADYVAQRNSNNRPRGAHETKTVKVNREVTVNMLIDKLLPAIEASWPLGSRKRVRIQQDNATPHPPPGSNAAINAKLNEMATRGWDIQFVAQPPNLPDCNTLDLAFFRAIQSLQYQMVAITIDDLIQNVKDAFKDLSLEVCIKVWSTAQMVMNEIIIVGGSNNYKLPHAGKDKIVRKIGRMIPLRLPCAAVISNSHLDGDAIRRASMRPREQEGKFVYCRICLLLYFYPHHYIQ